MSRAAICVATYTAANAANGSQLVKIFSTLRLGGLFGVSSVACKFDFICDSFQ